MLEMPALSSSVPIGKISPRSPSIAVPNRDYTAASARDPSPAPTYPHIINPSPVDSTGTADTGGTDIEDQEEEDPVDEGADAQPVKIETALAAASQHELNLENAPRSAILVSEAFAKYKATARDLVNPHSPIEPSIKSIASSHSSPSTSVSTPPCRPASALYRPARKGSSGRSESDDISKPYSISKRSETAQVLPGGINQDRGIPMAHVSNEARNCTESSLRRSVQPADVTDIQHSSEQPMGDNDDESQRSSFYAADDVDAEVDSSTSHVNDLREGFRHCWTLCNTLAQLSSQHRKRVFQQSGYSDIQEQAWRSCWKLCQSLYQNREGDEKSYIQPTLDMCRDFCQALFEARQKAEESTDSVLRVLWELQNHLYNTHDRNLPVAFQERTLDFYVTLCHRLMKQRTSLPEETEALLRTCWSLAEILFSIHQDSRAGKDTDEEHLGMAVQACWELCDLFRKGWTQIRPDRTTPRASQSSFPQWQLPSQGSSSGLAARPGCWSSTDPQQREGLFGQASQMMPPETPTTIFDDNPLDAFDNTAPNILVLGPSNPSSSSHRHWPSSVSSYSESSGHQTSTFATVNESTLEHLSNIRIMLAKAAMTAGFLPPRSPSLSTSSGTTASGSQRQRLQQQRSQAMSNFAETMPSNSFGTHAWQTSLVEKYRALLSAWPAFVNTLGGGTMPHETALLMPQSGQTRSAVQVAGSVQRLAEFEQYAWLRDLFRVVFGGSPDDAEESMDEVYVQI